MDLQTARELKRRIRREAGGICRFATGISLTRRAGDYRVAVLLQDERNAPALKYLQHEYAEIDLEIVGPGVMTTGGVARKPDTSTLKIGASVGHHRGGIGSLAFFAVRRSDGARGFVSCNHVIAMGDEGHDGDAVVSPSVLDGNPKIVGSLDGHYPRLENASADCAFASLNDGIDYDAGTVPGGALIRTPPEITEELAVTKAGRETDARVGVVKRIEVDDVWVRYGKNRVAFHNVIQIAAAGPWRFCEYGDSGALAYTIATFQPVGLIFATSTAGGPYNAGWTWAHPIRQVAGALNVDLVTV